jgi:hypothetical protein
MALAEMVAVHSQPTDKCRRKAMRRRYKGSNDQFGVTLLVVGVIVIGGLMLLKTLASERRGQLTTQNVAGAAGQEPIRLRDGVQQLRYQPPPDTYKAQPPSKSVSERMEEANRIRTEMIAIQRQLDGPRSVPGVVVGMSSDSSSSRRCIDLRAEREAIHERTRRGHTSRQAEYYRDRLRANLDAQCRADCIGC